MAMMSHIHQYPFFIYTKFLTEYSLAFKNLYINITVMNILAFKKTPTNGENLSTIKFLSFKIATINVNSVPTLPLLTILYKFYKFRTQVDVVCAGFFLRFRLPISSQYDASRGAFVDFFANIFSNNVFKRCFCFST